MQTCGHPDESAKMQMKAQAGLDDIDDIELCVPPKLPGDTGDKVASRYMHFRLAGVVFQIEGALSLKIGRLCKWLISAGIKVGIEKEKEWNERSWRRYESGETRPTPSTLKVLRLTLVGIYTRQGVAQVTAETHAYSIVQWLRPRNASPQLPKENQSVACEAESCQVNLSPQMEKTTPGTSNLQKEPLVPAVRTRLEVVRDRYVAKLLRKHALSPGPRRWLFYVFRSRDLEADFIESRARDLLEATFESESVEACSVERQAFELYGHCRNFLTLVATMQKYSLPPHGECLVHDLMDYGYLPTDWMELQKCVRDLSCALRIQNFSGPWLWAVDNAADYSEIDWTTHI